MGKPGNCHHCGHPGHWIQECPDLQEQLMVGQRLASEKVHTPLDNLRRPKPGRTAPWKDKPSSRNSTPQDRRPGYASDRATPRQGGKGYNYTGSQPAWKDSKPTPENAPTMDKDEKYIQSLVETIMKELQTRGITPERKDPRRRFSSIGSRGSNSSRKSETRDSSDPGKKTWGRGRQNRKSPGKRKDPPTPGG